MKQLEIHRWVRSIFCIALFLSWIPFLQAQEKRLIDLELNEVPLSTALRQLEREGGKNILFVNDEVEAYRVTVRIQKQPLAEAIQLVLKDKPFICLERQDYFVVQRMDKNKKVEYIRGKVVNEQGQPIPYANVLVLHAGDSTFVNGCVT
ncbi:MAG: carboxypeptidase-like regulatory domain-containing protein, partial [Bacteroidales bacterium]|nr:carboxypeptidase-like regulatory domain-containing protein [Bacteroidales bacterium]